MAAVDERNFSFGGDDSRVVTARPDVGDGC